MDRDNLIAIVGESTDPAVLDRDKLTAFVVEPDEVEFGAERNDHSLRCLIIRAGEH